MIYLDHNATSRLCPAARDAWLETAEQFFGNPSSPHRVGARADHLLNECREMIAEILGCAVPDIVWTSGATESNNTVLNSIAVQAEPLAEVWVSAIEHPSLLVPAQRLFQDRLRLIPVTREGVVDLDALRAMFQRSRPAVVAVMAANNETGTLQPWREILEVCQSRQTPFFCDAVQWLGKQSASGLGACDYATGSAHKFGGPRGVGFIKAPAGPMHPLIRGGPQEEGRRAGTENTPGVRAMAAALKQREEQIRAGQPVKMRDKKESFERALLEALPGAVILSRGAERLWNTTAALMPPADCRARWVVKLDKLGLAVSTGSACASGKEAPSHVLTAMGYGNDEAARALRFSSGWESAPEDWDRLLTALKLVWEEIGSAAE